MHDARLGREILRTLQPVILQLGSRTIRATGADALDAETLAGVLLEAIDRAKADASLKEAWQRRGEAFFRRQRRKQANGTGEAAARSVVDREGVAPGGSGAEAG